MPSWMFNTFNKGRDICISKNNDFRRPTLFSYSLIMFSLFNNDAGLTQKQRVLKMLQNNKEVSSLDFAKAGILRYWAHIFDLRKEGYPIKMRDDIKRQPNGKIIYRHTFYSL